MQLIAVSEPVVYAFERGERRNAPTPRIPSPHFAPGRDHLSLSLQQLLQPALQNLLRSVDDRLDAGLNIKTSSARETSEQSVADAANRVAISGEHHHRAPDGLDPRSVLYLAERLIETGQVANYLRAAELGRTVLAWYDDSLPRSANAARFPVPRLLPAGALERSWQRAPLMMLLGGWMVAGVVARFLLWCLSIPVDEFETVFSLWDIGFLAFVVIQFLATIRGVFANYQNSLKQPVT